VNGESFDFFLAAELHMTVAQLRNEMTHREYVKWQAWYSIKRMNEDLAMKKGG
jgi:hypothetical protein